MLLYKIIQNGTYKLKIKNNTKLIMKGKIEYSEDVWCQNSIGDRWLLFNFASWYAC